MITKRVTALMLPVALSACAATTVRGMREREPVLVSDSSRDIPVISACISDKWTALGATPRILPRTGGATIMIEQVVLYSLPILVVDMDAGPAGTQVVMHHHKSVWSKQNRQRIEEVRSCL